MMLNKMRVALFVLVCVLFGHLLGMATAWVIISRPNVAGGDFNLGLSTQKMPLFWEVWDIVEMDFVGQLPDSQTMTYGAIRGALSTLQDPYTSLIEPQSHQREIEDLQGTFGGIGVTMRRAEAGHIILSPVAEGPAIKAGVQEGDILIAAASQPITPSVSFETVIALVRGPVGTPVTIEIKRGNPSAVQSFTIIREEIELPSATWQLIEDEPDIGYIALARFSDRSSDEVKRAIADLRAQGAKRLILDLRNNGGGLRQAGIQVASLFLSDGVVMYQRQKNQAEESFAVIENDAVVDWPLVVLVNKGTASASEIVAGALQDYERAKLIGEQTFGKGSVQYIYDLSDSSSLHVTAAEWLTPDRHQLTGQGLTPDISVSLTQDDVAAGRDPQLDAALEYLKQNK